MTIIRNVLLVALVAALTTIALGAYDRLELWAARVFGRPNDPVVDEDGAIVPAGAL